MEPRAYGIITARAGSKRIPGKNIRVFHGQPLIVWTIHNLIQSGIFVDVIVSTDSEEISRVAQDAGAKVPFVRPADLADDYVPTAPVANHSIRWLIADGAPAGSEFCVAYPSAVSISKQDLVESRKYFREGQFDLVFTGCEFSSPPSRGWRLSDKGEASPVSHEDQGTRTQDIEPVFYDAGQFYWSKHDAWESIISGHPVSRGMFVLPRLRAIDIDTEEDWQIAERLFQMPQEKKSKTLRR